MKRTKSIPISLTISGLLLIAGLLSGCFSNQAPAPVARSAPVETVHWWNDAIFYEIFVRSFYDRDGDGNGDLAGLIEKLDYLNDGNPATTDDLGVTGLWLMPIVQSPSYHGYDATDYTTVEADYGSNDDFRRLIAEAHRRGIRVIVDLMLNHTSNQHSWFVEAASDPKAPRRDWYVWRASDPGHRSPWGAPAWHRSGAAYYHGLFWEGMPDLNFRNPAVTEEMYRVARFWLEEMGADGFRLDAVRHLIEKGDQYAGTPETHQWLVQWDDFMDQVDPQALTVGEIWGDTAEAVSYVTNDEVDIAFEFALADALLGSVNSENPAAFARSLQTVLAAYPPGQFAPFLTNHDQNRVMTQFGGDVNKAQLAATVLLTLPGVPFIYYGEEIGMTGAKPDELIRTPMQWNPGPQAGFTTGQPWEPVNRGYDAVNVAAQSADPTSLLSHYRRLIHLRNEQAALRQGGLLAVQSSCRAVYGYLRHAPATGTAPAESILVLLNFSSKPQRNCRFSLPESALAAGAHATRDLLTGERLTDLETDSRRGFGAFSPGGVLAPRQGYVLRLE